MDKRKQGGFILLENMFLSNTLHHFPLLALHVAIYHHISVPWSYGW